jgi:CPA2 family monovalent cation:H+ antiporter-2
VSPLLELGLIALGLYLAGWLSKKAGLSSIVGYIVLGLLLGPHGVYTLYELTPTVSMLGELGIIMLLFYMGIEFSLRRFLESGRATMLAGSLDLLNYAVGVGIGLLLGMGWLASLFLGGIVYISSSGVIASLLTEGRLLAYPETERTLGVLVFEDLAMVVILGGLALLTAGAGLLNFLGVLIFLVMYALFLRYGKGALERLLSREGEALVLLGLALVVLFSVGAQSLNFPEAVAAFLLGMIVAESDFKDRLESVLHPWRDVAAAAFFLDFGLHVDVMGALGQFPAALLLIAGTVVTNLLTGYVSGRLTGLSNRASAGHGLMLLPRGEFSLVIAGLAGTASMLPVEVRTALAGMTALYVIAMVVLGSLVFRYYNQLTDYVSARLASPAQRQRAAARRRELESTRLDG